MHDEETMKRFIACKRRNVAAAYERFLGPSAGAFPEPWHSRTWAGLVQALVKRRKGLVAAARTGESLG
jgi:hypothetical protein